MVDIQQRMLIEQRITNEKPSTGVAYLLLIFLGVFGAHRFYLRRTGTGVAMLLFTLTFFGLFVSGIWAFVDLFLIPGMIREDVEKLRQKLTIEAMNYSVNPSSVAATVVHQPTTPAPEASPI